jgi:hypothetical protein
VLRHRRYPEQKLDETIVDKLAWRRHVKFARLGRDGPTDHNKGALPPPPLLVANPTCVPEYNEVLRQGDI